MNTFEDLKPFKPYTHLRKLLGLDEYQLNLALHIPAGFSYQNTSYRPDCDTLRVTINVVTDTSSTTPKFIVADRTIGAKIIQRFPAVEIRVVTDEVPTQGSTVVNYEDADED